VPTRTPPLGSPASAGRTPADRAADDLHSRLVLEQLPTIHWTMDRALCFTQSTGAGLRAMGLKVGEVVGQSIEEFLQTHDPADPILRAHRDALAGRSVRFATVVRGLHYDCALEPLRDAAGAVVGVVGLAHDVTERHRAEEERRQLQEQVYRAQKLESLGVLAGGLAHDFGNLLGCILGAAGVLLRDLPAGSELRPVAETIRQAGERAGDLTRQMLVYAGKQPARRRAVDLNQLVRDNLTLLKSALPHGASVETALADDVPAVWADPGQLQQVVMNLLLNAAEALGEDGTVHVATGRVDVPGARPGEDLAPGPHAFVVVADDGCGMSPEVQARIFDPFFTTKARGRGLGLSAVQGIVRTHGGAIRLDSAVGRGTSFCVLLPAAVELEAPSCPN
jgi:PAS domain S-box-containing protein